MLKFLESKGLRFLFLLIGGLSSLLGALDIGLGCMFAYIISLELGDEKN